MITTSFSNDIMPRGYCQVVAFNEAKIVRLGLVKFKIFLLVFQDNSPILEKKKTVLCRNKSLFLLFVGRECGERDYD